jgi:hypothetical protein
VNLILVPFFFLSSSLFYIAPPAEINDRDGLYLGFIVVAPTLYCSKNNTAFVHCRCCCCYRSSFTRMSTLCTSTDATTSVAGWLAC